MYFPKEVERPFKEFFPDAAQRHTMHYNFAHKFLPNFLRANAAFLLDALFGDISRLPTFDPSYHLHIMYLEFEQILGMVKGRDVVNGITPFRRITDLTISLHRDPPGTFVALITMPRPERPAEAIFLALFFPSVRIFTLEAHLNENQVEIDSGFICEWAANGDHNNFGHCIRAEGDKFLKSVAVLLKIKQPGIIAASTNHPDGRAKGVVHMMPPPPTPGQPADQSVAGTLKSKAEEFFNQGLNQAEAQKLTEALASLETAVRLNDGHGEAWFRRGLILISLQRYPEALESLRKAQGLGHSEAVHHLNYWRGKLRPMRS